MPLKYAFVTAMLVKIKNGAKSAEFGFVVTAQ